VVEEHLDPLWIEHGYGTRFQGFQNLMRHRIRDVLLVSSLYDLYLFEEDGRFDELIHNEYKRLNLTHTPEFTRVSSGQEAIALAKEERRFDMILTTLHVEDMQAVRLAREAREAGIDGDAHAGSWHRQVSLLAAESIDASRKSGLDVDFGDFAENIATTGVDWKSLPIGTQVRIGDEVLLEITQIGKECIRKCAIFYQAGDCIMPREGIFARVLEGGTIRCGDPIELKFAESKAS